MGKKIKENAAAIVAYITAIAIILGGVFYIIDSKFKEVNRRLGDIEARDKHIKTMDELQDWLESRSGR